MVYDPHVVLVVHGHLYVIRVGPIEEGRVLYMYMKLCEGKRDLTENMKSIFLILNASIFLSFRYVQINVLLSNSCFQICIICG